MDWTSSTASGTPKPSWESVPGPVRERVERHIGRIERVETQTGGFTPSVTVRALVAGGRRVFIKAADGEAFPIAAAMHRDEARFLAGLGCVSQIPRLIATLNHDGWTVLVLDEVDGRHPRLPWQDAELDRVLDALERLSLQLTPSPIDAPTIGERLGTELRGWQEFSADAAALARLDLPWAHAHLDRLATIEQGWLTKAGGRTLLHADLRADQILLSSSGVHVVDWPHACIGAAWCDPLFSFPSIRLQGGPPIAELIRRSRLTAAVPRAQLTPVAVALAGYFLHRSTLPDPPGLPTVRRFQRAQGVVLAEWLSETIDRK